MSTKNVIIGILLCTGIGYAVGRYLQPAKIETKTEVVEVEVEKVKTEIRTIVREVVKPDGTVVKETIEEEIKKEEQVVKKQEKEETKIENLKPQWRVQAAVASDLDFRGELAYRLGVERRILGPFFAGVFADTRGEEVGVSISMEF